MDSGDFNGHFDAKLKRLFNVMKERKRYKQAVACIICSYDDEAFWSWCLCDWCQAAHEYFKINCFKANVQMIVHNIMRNHLNSGIIPKQIMPKVKTNMWIHDARLTLTHIHSYGDWYTGSKISNIQ
jgi:hypothetical protein